MRILHTSDWHLGRNLDKTSLREAQESFLDQLVDVVSQERIDALVVSGDIYDRAIPNAETVQLFEDAVYRLVEHTQVIITSGNHDNAQRLGFGGRLMERGGLHLRTSIADITRPVECSRGDARVLIYGIPYLEPLLANAALYSAGERPLGEDGQPLPATHDSVLRRATAMAAADLASRGGGPSVVMAHAWFTGAEASDSERPNVGGIENAGLSMLEPFSYAALGHLHKPQDPTDRARYSGSPIKYSFGEQSKDKRLLIVEFDAAGVTGVSEVALPDHRGMTDIQGTLQELLTSSEFAYAETCFVRAKLTDPEIPAHARDRLQARFPHIIRVELPSHSGPINAVTFEQRDPADVCCDFVSAVRGTAATDWERSQIDRARDHAWGRPDGPNDPDVSRDSAAQEGAA